METNLKDSIVEEVVQDLQSRSEIGIKKYNTTLDREDLTMEDWIQHAYEEALDFALYLKRLKKDIIEQNNQFDQLVKENIAMGINLNTLKNELVEIKKDAHNHNKRRNWHY